MLISKTYVPLLKTKPAEVEAFRQLSSSTKNATFPIFSLRPWPNANELSFSVTKIKDAVGDRPFGLTLDAERFGYPSKKIQATAQFDSLFNDIQGFQNYFEFIREIDNAVPVIQKTSDTDAILAQLSNAESLDRGLIIHQQRGSLFSIINSIIFQSELCKDALFIVDAAWSRDPQQLQAWSIPIIGKILDNIPEAEIVVMSTSFPDKFSHIVGTEEELAHEIHLYNSVRQRYQRADLKYGDWASTRLSQSGGGGSIPSRIDVPRPMSWQIFRADPKNDAGFNQVASDAVEHSCFSQLPDCWGKRLIAATDGDGNGITGTQKNTSSRINMHITIQADADETIDVDEQPYED